MSPVFNEKIMRAKKARVSRFMKKMGYSHQIGTHMTQKNHKDTKDDALHFTAMMRVKVAEMDPDDIINMDQTPTPYLSHKSDIRTQGNEDHSHLFLYVGY